MSAFDQIRDVYFGSARAPLRLTAKAKQRVLWTSAAPGVIVGAVLVSTAISIVYSQQDLSIFNAGLGPPLLIRRAYIVSLQIRSLDIIALALLFAAGLQSWTRAEGSWMILMGTALASVALVCGAFLVGAYAVLDPLDTDDIRADLWGGIAWDFGLLAIGYFFLAYRGAHAPEETRRSEPRYQR
jgi:hypothetical protein